MSNAKLKPVRLGRKVGYSEHSRVWLRAAKRARVGNASDLFEHGDFISPHGVVWRPCGLHYPGILLVDWKTGRRHSVDYTTIMRAHMLGWIWRPDSAGPLPKFTISRWPDGTHYYVRKPDGDPVVFQGREKFNSHGAAHRAGTCWAASVINPTKKIAPEN